MENNSFLQNTTLYSDKIMKQIYISKSDVLKLKKPIQTTETREYKT
jgi:hypothetical protein